MTRRTLPLLVTVVSAVAVTACDGDGQLPDNLDVEAVAEDGDDDPSRDLADVVVLDHGYDAVQSDVTMAWVTSASDPTVTLENRTQEPIIAAAFVDLRGLGLEDLRHDLGRVDLPVGEKVELTVDPSRLPLRVSGGSVWLDFGVEIDHADQPIEFRTAGGRLDFDEDQRPTLFDAAPPAPHSLEESLEQAAVAAFGEGSATVDGTQLNVVNDPADPRGPITFPGLFPPIIPIPPLPSTSRVCPTWRVHYADSTVGQDFMNESGVQHVPANFAHITISTPATVMPFRPGVQVYSGFLDEDGCTPQLDLDGNYVFSLTTKHRKGSLDVEVKNNDSASGFLGFATGSFTATTFGAAVYPTTSQDTRHTRSAAIVSRALATDDLPLSSPSNMLHVFADQNCPLGGFAACSIGDRLFIGRNASGVDMSERRHIVAHELGHNVSGLAIGHPRIDYSTGDAPTSQPLCRCDHVTFANQEHCIQSRETLESAFVEGFAHFVAAKLFNDPTTNGCRFGYYKEFLGTNNVIVPTPVTLNCSATYRWMENRGCADDNRGTELDWMNFLWALNQTLTLPEFFDVMREACSPGGGGCGGELFEFADIHAAVDSSPLTNSQKAGFDYAATVYGVDH